MYDRHFTVFQNKADGSILVVEQFKHGSFITGPGPQPSPGGCQTNNPPGGMVVAGVQGSMHGYFAIPMPPGQTLSSVSGSNPNCNAVGPTGGTNTACTTTGFINSHFTLPCYPVACFVTTFFFHYAAGDQGLIMHEWTNANVGPGNSGDIRSSTA
jgi:hypothetical protein